jgi:hypothetical protein
MHFPNRFCRTLADPTEVSLARKACLNPLLFRLCITIKSAQAADLQINGVEPRALFEFARTLGNVGVGAYPRSDFVHVDVRSRPTIWVDLSRDGEPAEYVINPDVWLKQHPEAGRHETFR